MKYLLRRETAWNLAIGGAAVGLVFLLPIVPDERLHRLKLQFFEGGALVLVFLVGLNFLITRPWSAGFSVLDWRDPHRRKQAHFFWALLLWGGWQSLLWFVSPERALASAELRRLGLGMGVLLSLAGSGMTGRTRAAVFFAWSASAGLLSLYGLLQFTGGWGVIRVPQMDRVMGTFGNPIFFSAYLSMSAFITLGVLMKLTTSPFKGLFGLIFLLEVLALFLTKTRSAWIGFAGALLLLGGWQGNRLHKGRVALAGLLLAGFFLLTKDVWLRDQGHLLIWRDTLRMWWDHPLGGVGLGSFHVHFPDYAQADLLSKWPKNAFIINFAHNEYLQMLAEGGVVSLSLFGVVLLTFWRWVKNHMEGAEKWFGGAVLALLIQNLFSADMRFTVSFGLCFFAMGLLTAPHFVLPVSRDLIASHRASLLARGLMVGGWVLFMAWGVAPHWYRSYQAERDVQRRAGFFDERLLNPMKTIAEVERLAASYPGEPAIYEKLAYLYAKEMKTRDQKINQHYTRQAISTYEKLIEMDPRRAAAYNNLANVLYTAGRSREAIKNWEKTIAINPAFLDSHLNLGKVFYQQGQLKESAHHFNEALKIDPGNAEAIVYLKKMVE